MHTNRRSARIIAAIVAVSLLLPLNSCGTLLHPERIGQRGGRIDPAIAILDAAGLLLFLIPGIVAFAVDFSNGTIYLPPDCYSAAPAELTEKKLVAVRFAPHELTPGKIEQVVHERTGQPIDLQSSDVRVGKLQDLDRFDAECANLAARPDSAPTQLLFR